MKFLFAVLALVSIVLAENNLCNIATMSATVYTDNKCTNVDAAATKKRNKMPAAKKQLFDGKCHARETPKRKLPRSVKITCDESLTIKRWKNKQCNGQTWKKVKMDFGKCQKAGKKWIIVKK